MIYFNFNLPLDKTKKVFYIVDMNKSLKQLKKRLSGYFKRKDSMNQASFCKFAGVSESSVSRLRSGEREGLNLETYERIIDAMNKVIK